MLLYKYFPPERNAFLKERLLRFTPPGLFNDPFDSLPVIEGFDTNEIRERVDRIAKEIEFNIGLETLTENERRKKLLALKFASSSLFKDYSANPILQGSHFLEFLRRRMNNEIGILCLSKNPRSILMWSHYAIEHKGFVVGFDSEDKFFHHQSNEPEEIGKLLGVHYVKNRTVIDIQMIKNQKSIPDILFSKNYEWSYEQEWRIIRLLKGADEIRSENTHLFKVPSTAIREVIFGCKAEPTTVEILHTPSDENSNLKHVSFFKAALSRTKYEMDILPVPA